MNTDLMLIVILIISLISLWVSYQSYNTYERFSQTIPKKGQYGECIRGDPINPC